MASRKLYPDSEIPLEVQLYEDLQKQIDQIRFNQDSDGEREQMLEGVSSRDQSIVQPASIGAVRALEAQKKLVWEEIRRQDPVVAGQIKVDAPTFMRMRELIDQPTTAILSFYTTTDNTYIFVLRQDRNTPALHISTGEGVEILQGWILENWLQPYIKDKDAWQSQISNFLIQLAQRLQLDNLINQYLKGIKELVLVPHLLLHQIPLAALPIKAPEYRYLGDKFLIRYVPSCQVLEFCREREKRYPVGDFLTYGIIEDATENLASASFEGEQIAHLCNIPESNRLRGRSQATKSKYRKLAERVQVLHSCHHAQYRLDEPLESSLQLADETLTLGELLTPSWRLLNLSDVFLSCCETGLGVPRSLADEILTLSTGFLCAGARSVVSTLWSVNDLATALFSILYYQHRLQSSNRPEALQQAQIQLRSLKKEDLKEISRQVHAKRKEARGKRSQYQAGSIDYLKWDLEYRKYAGVTNAIGEFKTSPDEEPFSHPCYWAAFTCSGSR